MAEQAGSGRRGWLLPAVTFLVGVVLGGGVIAATTSGGSTDTGSVSPTASASPAVPPDPSPGAPPDDATVTVPGECVQLSEDSEDVLDLVEQAATAARDLDAAGLSQVVREMQDAQETLRKHAADCRDAAASPSPSAS